MRLETERLRLRRFRQDDLEQLVALHGHPEVMRFITGTPTPRKVVEGTVFPRFLRYDPCRPVHGVWAAERKDGGEFLGWFSLERKRGGSNVEATIGFRLAPRAWGQGYATEGARMLLAQAFATGVRRVFATVYEENLPSRRVLEKLGMTLQRRYKLTKEALARGVTFEPSPEEVWEGDELEYVLDPSGPERSAKPAGSPEAFDDAQHQ